MPETALDPSLPICDPHHHLYPWDYRVHDRYLVEDLERDLALGHNVLNTVYVETSGSAYREDGPVQLRPVGETEWVSARATDRFMQGHVAFADLMLGDAVSAVLDEHARAARGRLSGIRFRHMTEGQPDPPADFLDLPVFRRAAGVVQERELVLDLFVMYDRIPAVVSLARAMPDLFIVLNHLGMPVVAETRHGAKFSPADWSSRSRVLAQWRTWLAPLAECENVFIKLGGIGMPLLSDRSWFSTPPTSAEIAAVWGPEIRFVVELFGTSRCMFESNWPVDEYLCDYSTLWNSFKRMVADANDGERANLFSRTAARVYRLPDVPVEETSGP